MIATVTLGDRPNQLGSDPRSLPEDQGRLARLLIISHDVVGSRMAGPGIRYWEMARVLATQQPVTLIAPQPIDIPAPGFVCGSYGWGDAPSLAAWLRDAEAVVANGFVLRKHPELARIAQPLALDLYDPVLLEDLELFRAAPEQQRHAQYADDRALLAQQLAAGDFLLCATERQRDLYLGALLLSGRITPQLVDADPQLRRLIDVVPFGLPAEPPVKQRPALRGVVPGIGADDPLLLWTGGLWDWMDPQTLIRAMPQVVGHHPDARLVFLAGTHPGTVPPMRAPQEALALAAELGLLGRHVFFYEAWIPYQQRADFLLEADIAVSLHRDRLETAYAAVRSRFLDHLWAGLPSVVSGGDAAADLVQRHRLGRVVRAEDVAAVAAALIALIGDAAERQACAANARALAAEFVWERTLQPLLKFCRRPFTMTDRSPMTERPPTEVPDVHAARNAAITRLDQLWKVHPQELTSALPLLGRAKNAANSLTRWYVQTIVEQQNTFNAAVVHALQQLAETGDHYQSSLDSIQTQLENITAHLQSLQRQVDGIAAKLDRLARESEPLHQHIADIEVHLCDIDDAQTAMAQRLATPALEAEPQP
jgi:glycosyltransferase involved in cell wall biosynthesis/prefoldin subunit 5